MAEPNDVNSRPEVEEILVLNINDEDFLHCEKKLKYFVTQFVPDTGRQAFVVFS